MAVSEKAVLDFVQLYPEVGRGQIRAAAAPDHSEVTVWRAFRTLVEKGTLTVACRGPG